MSVPENIDILNACPYLGSAVDADTRFAYPSAGNWCYRLPDPQGVALGYQQGYCLSAGHTACPLFAGETQTLPAAARRQERTRIPGGHSLWGWVTTLLLLLAIAGGFLLSRGQTAHPGAAATSPPMLPSPAASPSATPSPTSPPTYTPAAAENNTLAPTAPPSSTPTPAPPTAGPALETPFGVEGGYLVHKVRVGESLTAIANRYNTTVDVLRAVNVFVPGATLWAGQSLVVLPGVTVAPADVQPLLPVFVARDTTLSALAQQYSADAETLRRLNALGPEDFIPGGRWILIPQKR